jgi:hypothetical protein
MARSQSRSRTIYFSNISQRKMNWYPRSLSYSVLSPRQHQHALGELLAVKTHKINYACLPPACVTLAVMYLEEGPRPWKIKPPRIERIERTERIERIERLPALHSVRVSTLRHACSVLAPRLTPSTSHSYKKPLIPYTKICSNPQALVCAKFRFYCITKKIRGAS